MHLKRTGQTKSALNPSLNEWLSDGYLYVLKWPSVSSGQLKMRDNGFAVVLLAELLTNGLRELHKQWKVFIILGHIYGSGTSAAAGPMLIDGGFWLLGRDFGRADEATIMIPGCGGGALLSSLSKNKTLQCTQIMSKMTRPSCSISSQHISFWDSSSNPLASVMKGNDDILPYHNTGPPSTLFLFEDFCSKLFFSCKSDGVHL